MGMIVIQWLKIFPYSHFSSSFYIMRTHSENFYRIISTTLSTTFCASSLFYGMETFVIILLMAKICILIVHRKKSNSFLFLLLLFLRELFASISSTKCKLKNFLSTFWCTSCLHYNAGIFGKKFLQYYSCIFSP